MLAARLCALNILGALKQELGELARIERIVKVVGFVCCAAGFTRAVEGRERRLRPLRPAVRRGRAPRAVGDRRGGASGRDGGRDRGRRRPPGAADRCASASPSRRATSSSTRARRSEFAQTVEELGFDHIVAYDHVLGAGRENRPDWDGFHDEHDRFHEVLVLFGYLAAVTESIELVTGILCLPQRQTALVAKQAAEIDRSAAAGSGSGSASAGTTSSSRALGADFHTRGRRIEEQIEVLRALWTQPTVEIEGDVPLASGRRDQSAPAPAADPALVRLGRREDPRPGGPPRRRLDPGVERAGDARAAAREAARDARRGGPRPGGRSASRRG